MHEQDSSIDATPLTSMEAAQEVVADMMGLILKGGGNLIHQMAAEEPGTARRILDSIKSFLKKLDGSDSEWKSDTQREMPENALKIHKQMTAEHSVRYLKINGFFIGINIARLKKIFRSGRGENTSQHAIMVV